ncbi:MAG: hypothetical protein ACE5FQ_13555 [Thiogranum sp.]
MATTRKPGRPTNQLTPARQLIEQNTLKLAEKALNLALLGDVQALGLLLDRVWPPRSHPPVRLDPAAIRSAVSKGLIPRSKVHGCWNG